ncbi:MAG TPA: hypothetical protein VES02_16565 [Dermatophilaceae bacterium]|nr:hypothetical protein [Dermatophilaceae bacterium]
MTLASFVASLKVSGARWLIRRAVSTKDRRRFDVSLTPRGRRRFDGVWPDHAAGTGRYVVTPLDPHDLDELGRILTKLIRTNTDPQG